MGTGHGPADPHRRLSLVDGPGREGRHRRRACRASISAAAPAPGCGSWSASATSRGCTAWMPRQTVVERGRRRCQAEGLADRIAFTLADACDTGLPAASADFVWGEDAWCYVVDKPRLIAEAARLVKPGGTIAFTDWVEGPAGLTPRRGRALPAVHEVPQRPGPRRLRAAAGRPRAARCWRRKTPAGSPRTWTST